MRLLGSLEVLGGPLCELRGDVREIDLQRGFAQRGVSGLRNSRRCDLLLQAGSADALSVATESEANR